jgi:thiol-disulfide isomerase/thioredoxin
MKQTFVLLFLLNILTSCAVDSNVIKFNLKLEGKQYDSLTITCRMIDFTFLQFSGKTTDGFDWHFTIPKDIYEQQDVIRIIDPVKRVSIVHFITMNYINSNGDTIKPTAQGHYNLEAINTVNLKFLKTVGSTEQTILTRQGYMGWENDIFIIPEHQAMKLMGDIIVATPFIYNMFQGEYDEDIELHIKIASENPDNVLLVKSIYRDLYDYKTREDVKKVFEKLSEKNKKSYYGRKIQKYLDMVKFENHNLLSMQTGDKESIVQDSSKFNLIIFSASWCAPCIASIPKYQKIYEDLSGKVILTYISEDNPKDIDKWKQLTEKHDIKWRSLLAMDELQTIKDKYFASVIPYILLVYPDGNMERLTLFTQEDMDKLYEIVKQ